MSTGQPLNNPFAATYLERRSEARHEPDWPHSALADPSAQFILGHATRLLVRRAPHCAPAFLSAQHPAVRSADSSQLMLLGWYHGRRCVLVGLGAEPAELPGDVEFTELRPLLHLLSADAMGLLAYARALLIWRSRHRHCGVCGALTAPHSAGHVLRCANIHCGAEVFPRIDPAIIVLVTDADHALLGRQPSWPAGRYSALAGFVEAGECLEDAVIREVQEETGVHVDTVRYFGSQPWPFPASLMLGFHAHAARGAVQVTGELEDARWFTRAELRASAPTLLPPPHTIARHLLERWFESNSAAASPPRGLD